MQAVNDQSHTAALKTRQRRCRDTAKRISREIQTLKAITTLARQHNESRILQLRDVMYQFGNEDYQQNTTEDVYLLLDPFLPFTVDHIIEMDHGNPLKSRLALWVLHEAMLGLQFLHQVGWMHGDIKPGNIGIELPHILPSSLEGLQAVRVVLLDLDNATNLQSFGPNPRLPPTPGRGGTVPYLAPERELEYQSYTSDVWAVAVTGYELRYGEHPWNFSANAWRPMASESLRTNWLSKYEHGIARLQKGIAQFLVKPVT